MRDGCIYRCGMLCRVECWDVAEELRFWREKKMFIYTATQMVVPYKCHKKTCFII
jgi:hypothetical protein